MSSLTPQAALLSSTEDHFYNAFSNSTSPTSSHIFRVPVASKKACVPAFTRTY